MIPFADALRSLFSPLTVRALQAGAEALDERDRLLATIAGLEETVAAQARRLRELDPPTEEN